MLRFPPPLVGILATLQVGVIAATCLIVRTFYKLYEAHMVPQFGPMPQRFNWALHFMIGFGPSLLLVPLIWGTTATLWADNECRVPMVTTRQSQIGLALSGALLIFCAFSVIKSLWLLVAPIP